MRQAELLPRFARAPLSPRGRGLRQETIRSPLQCPRPTCRPGISRNSRHEPGAEAPGGGDRLSRGGAPATIPDRVAQELEGVPKFRSLRRLPAYGGGWGLSQGPARKGLPPRARANSDASTQLWRATLVATTASNTIAGAAGSDYFRNGLFSAGRDEGGERYLNIRAGAASCRPPKILELRERARRAREPIRHPRFPRVVRRTAPSLDVLEGVSNLHS